MSFGEAIRLTGVLAGDPSSQVYASLAKWRHPLSREALMLADHYDLTHKIAAGKRHPKAYPRPWDARERKFGGGARLSKARLRAVLDAHRNADPVEQEPQIV